jgi:hypothetical protein
MRARLGWELLSLAYGPVDGLEERQCLFVGVWYLNADFSLAILDTAVYLIVPSTVDEELGDVYGEFVSGGA